MSITLQEISERILNNIDEIEFILRIKYNKSSDIRLGPDLYYNKKRKKLRIGFSKYDYHNCNRDIILDPNKDLYKQLIDFEIITKQDTVFEYIEHKHLKDNFYFSLKIKEDTTTIVQITDCLGLYPELTNKIYFNQYYILENNLNTAVKQIDLLKTCF